MMDTFKYHFLGNYYFTGHVVTFKMHRLKGTPDFSPFLFKVFAIYSHSQMKLPSKYQYLLLSFAPSCHFYVHHIEVLNHFLLLALVSIKPRAVALTCLNIFFACSKSLYTVYYTVTAWEKKSRSCRVLLPSLNYQQITGVYQTPRGDSGNKHQDGSLNG